MTGWTGEEYEKCPELVNRLHGEILDLRDALEHLRAERDEYKGVLGRIVEREIAETDRVASLARAALNQEKA